MKVYVFGTRGFPGVQGGVEKHCEYLYMNFPKDIQVTVFRRKSYIHQNVTYSNISFIDLPSTKIKGIEALVHSFLCSLVCIIKRPDIVHIHNIGPGFFVPLLRLFNLKVVLTYHSANYEHKKWGWLAKHFLKLSEKTALIFSNKIIFVNNFQLKKYRKSIQNKSIYIPNGVSNFTRVDSIEYLTKLGVEPGKYILSVGRITPEKGLDILIEAFSLANIEKDGFQLVIAGSVENEMAYFHMLQTKSINKKVIFAGGLNKECLRELYSHTKLFILSSYSEGFPLVVLEAMQAGCNILLSKIPATQIVSLDEKYYFKKGDVTDLAKQIKKKVAETQNIFTYPIKDYSWNRVQKKTIIVYKTLFAEQYNQ